MLINPKSIRVRLIAWYVFSLGCVHLILAAVLYQMMSGRLHYELDQRLATYTTCLVELLPQHRQLELAEVIKEMAELTALGPDLYVRVTDQTGRVVYASTALPQEAAAGLASAETPHATPPRTIQLPSHGLWRMTTQTVRDGAAASYVGHVAIPLRGVQQDLARLLIILLLVVPCVMLLASAGAWLLLNRALKPLDEAIRTAQMIQANDLSQRLQVVKTGDEVQALAETFNHMIERLQCSFAQMRQFISDASHELRTPLTVLKGELELGLRACPRSDGCEILATCSGEIQRLSRLVDTLLVLSNADAGKITFDPHPIPLCRVLEEMVEQAKVLAEPKGIQVEFVNDSSLTIRADPMRLQQLLLNLVDNAVKYTPERGRIRLSCHADNGHVEIRVADTGIGIDPKDMPRIFDRFYRADQSRNRSEGGYGLGLAICKWIAEAHHGTIHVDSAPGKGSTFLLRLPVA